MFTRLRQWDRATRTAPGPMRGLALSRLPIRRATERRPVLLWAAAALFAAVFAARQTSTDSSEALGLLYVAPIALTALDLGLVAGLAAAALAFALVGVWALTLPAHLEAVGWFTRAFAYLAVATLAGRFSDRMRDAQERQHRLLGSGLALAHLRAVDELAVLVADAANAICRSHRARVEIGAETEASGELGDGVAMDRVEIPIEVRGLRYGTLSLDGPGRLTDEDRASLGILALQAAVAAESRRLLDAEREHAMIRAQLQDVRDSLERRTGQLRDVLDRQEDERTELARELHEQAAQTLAAVLLGLGAVERRWSAGDVRPDLAELRGDLSDTLRSLRSLAVALKPSTTRLGARVAIEDLLARADLQHVTTALEGLSETPRERADMIYRIVEEALTAAGPARSGNVLVDAQGTELTIDLDGTLNRIDPARLSLLHARVAAAGGTVSASEHRLLATAPIHPADPVGLDQAG